MTQDNILLITTDQQRFDTINAWGNTSIFTPHLNYMAAMGTSFRSCYACCPICVPSRTTIMTGRHGYESGVVSNATHEAEMRRQTKTAPHPARPFSPTPAIRPAQREDAFRTGPGRYAFEQMTLLWTTCANMTGNRNPHARRPTESVNVKWNRFFPPSM